MDIISALLFVIPAPAGIQIQKRIKMDCSRHPVACPAGLPSAVTKIDTSMSILSRFRGDGIGFGSNARTNSPRSKDDKQAGEKFRVIFNELFFTSFLTILLLAITCALRAENVDNTKEPLPEVSAPPAKYQYPMLVCGKPLPVHSGADLNTLQELYQSCVAKNCDKDYEVLASSAKEEVTAIKDLTFKESLTFIKRYEDTSQGYIVLCAFFGSNKLEYVSCNYKLRTNIDYQGAYCQDLNERVATQIFGPNRAKFSVELREMPASKVPLLLEQYGDRRDYLEANYVSEYIFHQRGRFAGLIQGSKKVRAMDELNCENLTFSDTESLKVTGTALPPLTNTLGATNTLNMEPTISKTAETI